MFAILFFKGAGLGRADLSLAVQVLAQMAVVGFCSLWSKVLDSL